MLTLIAQFGGGFNTQDAPFTEGIETNEGALSNLELFISNSIGVLTVFASIFFIVYFLIAALSWVTSGGDSGKLQTARERMLHGVLGLVIVVAAYGIIGLIGSIIGFNLLEPASKLIDLAPAP
ncbi:MAG: hypothetical protein GW762_04690 [Candidatus Pacebacteria bacterium]|nr:hypothetical protein [Candidatus Paceibacterota bacterium]PIR64182.1 MAG: hypothetical protein COU64_00500 [Candidatus Pacebacteria bacterium CG10_big_fil_rev_8_21_14_0_10_40_26]PIZ79294.1 MAG: hypothetical protein COY01_02620 [Candidatus Pacebacteria bacterium CG_4_10_14_0_2_um_filter_40_20]PJA68950.1 MAG: hypothetical protein CO156_03230 [Candidatus Pacebacteria bacterium CG_4_9_14_3_um_filter_40_12]PJC42261.1 MAG: hypothetical protein CO041_01330 [Candidatus Pacebacteria bacterium CG_4_9_